MTLSKKSKAIYYQARLQRQTDQALTAEVPAMKCKICGSFIEAVKGDLYSLGQGTFNTIEHLCHDCAKAAGCDGRQIKAHH